MKDELTDNKHLEILKNDEADLFERKMTFKEYVSIGFNIEKALERKSTKLLQRS
ncbi:hypothetical protein PG326_10630 [Riemerella anatipestifer]|nr:hypothetical protein [Riemerella anatipestifer]MDY3358768.1 hypothetical protein [Riemerella anatipestifer]